MRARLFLGAVVGPKFPLLTAVINSIILARIQPGVTKYVRRNVKSQAPARWEGLTAPQPLFDSRCLRQKGCDGRIRTFQVTRTILVGKTRVGLLLGSSLTESALEKSMVKDSRHKKPYYIVVSPAGPQ